MATELVTAHSGQNHVGSDDIGALYAGALGNGRFALDVGEGMAVSMTDANTLRIGTGGFLFDGRWVRVTRAEEVKIANGTQGGFRKDLVVYTYRRSPSSGNVETGEWAVIQGTAASTEAGAVPPEVKRASILDGDLEVQCPVAEVDLSGLTPTARLLLPSAASLKSVGDSVSRTKIYTGSVVKHAGDSSVVVWTKDEFRAKFGAELSPTTFIGFYNGDHNKCSVHVDGASVPGDYSSVYATFGRVVASNIRLNYLVVIPA